RKPSDDALKTERRHARLDRRPPRWLEPAEVEVGASVVVGKHEHTGIRTVRIARRNESWHEGLHPERASSLVQRQEHSFLFEVPGEISKNVTSRDDDLRSVQIDQNPGTRETRSSR